MLTGACTPLLYPLHVVFRPTSPWVGPRTRAARAVARSNSSRRPGPRSGGRRRSCWSGFPRPSSRGYVIREPRTRRTARTATAGFPLFLVGFRANTNPSHKPRQKRRTAAAANPSYKPRQKRRMALPQAHSSRSEGVGAVYTCITPRMGTHEEEGLGHSPPTRRPTFSRATQRSEMENGCFYGCFYGHEACRAGT